jgi:hypothetical protein
MALQSSWNAFSAFQVFGDHVPMDGFSLVVRIAADTEGVEQLLATRARQQDNLDPELAMMMLRAGLGLAQAPAARFVYANSEETIVVLRPESVQEVGQSLELHDHMISTWAARMALISGECLPVSGQVYELPDLGVVRTAVRTAVDQHEDRTPLRCARRLGAQLRGRGEPFHLSMVETLEEQSHLLEEHGINMNELPSWWWRGVGARSRDPNDSSAIELWSELPAGDQLVSLIG